MTIQTLVSTMNRGSLEFLDDMNIETDVIVGNQNGKQSKKLYKVDGKNILEICSDERGLSKNRNLTIKYSNADICLLADDDIEYCTGYSKIVESAFEKNPDADIIIFNLYEDPIERYVIKDTHRLRWLEYLRYGSVRIAFKRKSIYKNVTFDERFGAGGDIPIGEDTIFLSDCLKKRLKIIAVPNYILHLKQSESTWFEGYTEKYFQNKGKMYKRMFGKTARIICLQDAVRHKAYGSFGSWRKVYSEMCKGIKDMAD